MRRRRFLRTAAFGSAGALLRPSWLLAQDAPSEVRLVILHTNDTHSRIDPFPMDGGPYQGLGGVSRRASLVDRIRDQEPNVLLLDSGDIFQGTPYFNFFHGEIELSSMSSMAYDAATLGNHDFDNGVEGLVEVLPNATFPFVSANYDAARSPLEAYLKPWIIRELEGVKVGVFGLGIAFEGLVLPRLHEGVRYTDPYHAARRSVQELRAEGCSLILCLSHLGYRYRDERPSDTILAQEVDGIDLILGGHTHTFMDDPDVYLRADGGHCIVTQDGFGGIRLGRIDVVMKMEEAGPRAGSNPEPPRRFRPIQWSAGGYSLDRTDRAFPASPPSSIETPSHDAP